MKKSVQGFTLIELLIVVAIMVMVSIFTISNYKSFGEEQNLKSTVLDIQSLLRQAQTSAIANAICNGVYTASWQVVFAGTRTSPAISLKCSTASSSLQKPPLVFSSTIIIDSVTGTGIGGSDCPTDLPFTVDLSLLKGNISFEQNSVVAANCTSLTLTLKNTKTPQSSKTLVIEQGGGIYGQ